MEVGAISSGLVTGLREGVEAALIVSIVLAYLARTDNLRFAGRIWLGVAAAVATSAALGVVLFVTVGELPEPYEQIFEGATLLVAAGIVGVGFYHGSRRINLARFFRWTGIALIVIAAGLVGRGIHEFAEIGLIGQWTQRAFDLSAVLPDDVGLGAFLRAVVGYAAAPEIITLVAQLGYLLIVLVLYLRPTAPRIAATPSPV